MKTINLFAFALLAIIFSCGTDQGKIKDEVNSYKIFSDSLLAANSEFIKGIDTTCMEGPSKDDPAVVVVDTIISNHSNLFDTSQFLSKSIIPTLNKYNSLEQHLDSEKDKMDAKTLELFESIKQKINEIKQPIK